MDLKRMTKSWYIEITPPTAPEFTDPSTAPSPAGNLTKTHHGWNGGFYRTPTGLKVLLRFARVGSEYNNWHYFIDCTPPETPGGVSTSPTYGQVYSGLNYYGDGVLSPSCRSVTDWFASSADETRSRWDQLHTERLRELQDEQGLVALGQENSGKGTVYGEYGNWEGYERADFYRAYEEEVHKYEEL
ncbi:hypothetical protein HDV00_008385 [Rhizophlyctis rosea]|nr:hypothetical protein HDV00_008385 [Rhizophlyctis rosea]